MAYTTEIQKHFELLKQEVCRMLEFDEQQYADMQFKAGCQYLQAYIPNDPTGIDQLLEQPIYWNWWRNHWAMRDEQFCYGHVECLGMKLRTDLYHQLHNPNILASEIRPNGVILRLAYAGMIDNVHQQIQQL